MVNKKLTFSAYNKIGGGAPRTRTFYNLLRSIQNFRHAVLFASKLLSSISKLRLRASNYGAILIEFAVCMPILIILLFYINDLMKIKRFYAQTEFVAQQAANILQNISQKRTDKKITGQDFKHAISLAFLSMYPGKTMFWTSGSRNREIVYTPYVTTYYIKGVGGNASVPWKVVQFIDSSSRTSPLTTYCSIEKNPTYSSTSYDILHVGQNVTPTSIHPLLKIQDGECKIILEVKVERGSSYRNMSGQVLNDKQAFGLFLVNPKFFGSSTGWHHLFHSFVIFTPKPGLFSETASS